MWPFGSKVKSAKRSHEIEVISDLDDLISRRIGIRFKGATYEIPPLSLMQFLAVANALAYLDELRTKKSRDEKGLLTAYQELFDKTLNPKIDVSSMNYVQVSALFNQILECIMGKVGIEQEKKNREMMAELKDRAQSLTSKSAQ